MQGIIYEAKVNWVEEPFRLIVDDYKCEIKHKYVEIHLAFLYEDRKYFYVWSSTPSIGLASLYLIHGNEKIKVYDAYGKEWQNQHIDLCDAARLLSVYCQKNVRKTEEGWLIKGK